MTMLTKGRPIKVIHQLKYSPEFARWHAYDGNTYCYSLHCGDGLCLRVSNHYFPAHMELDTHWYVLIEDDKFRLHPNQIYDAFLF